MKTIDPAPLLSSPHPIKLPFNCLRCLHYWWLTGLLHDEKGEVVTVLQCPRCSQVVDDSGEPLPSGNLPDSRSIKERDEDGGDWTGHYMGEV